MRIAAFLPFHSTGLGISHICVSLCDGIRAGGVEVKLVMPSCAPEARGASVQPALPLPLARALYRLGRRVKYEDAGGSGYGFVDTIARRRFRRELGSADVAYIWPGTRLDVFDACVDADVPIILERVNCHRKTAARILAAAYARLGIDPPRPIAEADVALEQRKLGIAAVVSAPSPAVRDSLVDAGVPAEKIVTSTYGWDPRRIGSPPARGPRPGPLRVLFVGSVVVRKGVHLLLDAWARAGIDGELVLAGEPSAEIRRACAAQLGRPDVRVVGFVRDVGALYDQADVFVLPSLEEGSPLVTYEAMAKGLPVLVSPMGAGGVVRDQVDGLVLDPEDVGAWAAALRGLASDPGLRTWLGDAAAKRAREFTWAEVGARRARLFRQAFERLAGGGRLSA